MQGFISGITKLKNEDIIVQIITERRFLSLYRFYGLRHSIINIGRKIDFEIEYNGLFMPKLRNIMQISFAWEADFGRLYHWQQFLKLLNSHLRDTDEIPSFYFELLDFGAERIERQSPQRILIEMYAKLLDFEGRSSTKDSCFVCDNKLDSKIALARGFLSAHEHCIDNNGELIDKEKFFDFLKTKKGILLDNGEVGYLLRILLLGI